MTDDPSAALAEIRERGYENGAHGAQAARLSDAAAIDVPRLLAALDKVLEAAGDAKATSFGAVGDGPLKPVAWNLDPGELRAAVLAALTGKEGGNVEPD